MCGLSAYFSSPSSSSNYSANLLRIKQSLLNISHRGPDESNILSLAQDTVLFAHARLSVIDISNGSQPFTDSTGRYTIVFNGELYNYIELRETYSLDCRSSSDTEVVLQAYIRFGPDCLQYFRGMYAFAIWDNLDNVGFIARDRFGIKPLYLARSVDGVTISSEVKGLLPFFETRQVCTAGLADYINFQFTLPSRTLFSGVEEFLPALCFYTQWKARTIA